MAFFRAEGQAITVSSFTSIGDFTASAGLAAAFTGSPSKALAASAGKATTTSGYIGKTLNSAFMVQAIQIFGSSDAGFVAAINPTVTANVYGKMGTAPANATDGTLVASAANTDGVETTPLAQGYSISVSISVPRYWDHVWVQVTQNGAANNMYVAELVMFKVWDLTKAFGATETLAYSGSVELYNLLRTNHFDPNCPCFMFANTNEDAVVTADFEDDDFPVTNIQNPSTALGWKSISTNTQFIYVDGAGPFNSVGIAVHNLGSADIAVSVEVQNATGTGYYQVTEPRTPIDDGPLMIVFPNAEQGAYRIRFAAGDEPPEAGVIYGSYAMFGEHKIYVGHAPFPNQLQMNVVNGVSESGQFLGRIVLGRSASTTIELIDLTADYYRAWIATFLQFANEAGLPFFFAWRPKDYYNETGYVWLTNSPTPVNQRSNGMLSITLEVGGMVRPVATGFGDPLLGQTDPPG